MSTHTTVSGTLTFDDEEAFAEALRLLREGGWMNDDDQLVDENNSPILPWSTVHHDAMVLGIPGAMYQNINSVLHDIVELADEAALVGCLEESGTLFVETDTERVLLDTREWAKVHSDDDLGMKSFEDPGVDDQEYMNWKDDVREKFFNSHETAGIADVDVFAQPAEA